MSTERDKVEAMYLEQIREKQLAEKDAEIAKLKQLIIDVIKMLRRVE